MRPAPLRGLVDMGVPSYLVASSVIAILAQRLVRVVCTKCKQPYMPTDAVLEAAGIRREIAEKAHFAKVKGAETASEGGYRGRIGIYELLLMRAKIRELSFQGASTQEIRKVAMANGMKTLYQDGMIRP